MKKDYLVFPRKQVSYLPKITTRRFRGLDHSAMASYKSDGGEEGGEGGDDAAKEELLKTIETRMQKHLAERTSKEDVAQMIAAQMETFKTAPLDALRAMADDKTGVFAMLANQGMEIKKLQERMAKGENEKDLSLRGQIKAWVEENKEAILQIRGGQKANLKQLEIRVASPMTVATVNAGNSPYIGKTVIESGINDFLRYPNTFWDSLTKGSTDAATYGWVNKTNPLGEAAFIGPGVAKPGISFALEAETSVAKKIADSAKTTTELLQDIAGMETFIEQELKEQVFIKVNSTLMNSAGSSTVPKGIQDYSVAYNLGAGVISTTNPTYADAIRAVVAQLRSGKLTGEITVFINSIDAANMDLAKASDSGVYMLPPFVTADGRKIGGATIKEDPNMAVGYFQAAFLRYYRILIYKPFTVSWGWENDDFTKNLVTAVGEMRLHQFVNNIHTGFAVYDTFAHVIGDITA